MKKIPFFLAIIIAAGFIACENKDVPDKPPAGATTISFDANGGSKTMQDQLIPENTSADLTANKFTRSGYTFEGWAVTANGTVRYTDGQSYSAGAGTKSITLYAVWKEIIVSSSTITFNANGGSGTMPTQQIPENTSAALTANTFTRSGYTFEGWAAVANGTVAYTDGQSYTAGAGTHSVTLYAVWKEISAASSTVTFNANGGSGGQTASVTAVYGAAMPAIAAAPVYETNSHPNDPYENNYEKKYFNGYYDAQTGGTKYYNANLSSANNWDKQDAAATLYAQWLTPAETLGVTLGGAGAAQNGWIDDFIAYFVDTPPTIDGNGDDSCWAKAKWVDINYAWMYQSNNITLPTGASTPNPAGGRIEKTADFSGRFKAVWTANRLYVLTEIIDDQIKTPNTGNVYQNPENNDCLEIFISESASASTQARGTTANSTSHFFAYHMNFTDMVSAMDYVGGPNNTSTNDPNTRIENGFIKRNHHLNFKIGKNDGTHTYIWETEMKVYGNDYPVITSPEDRTPVTLTDGKKMGFAVAYNDNDTTTRNHFIGSMYVQGSTDDARNQGYKNPSVYAKLYLVK
jgi:uncharacterized repeat protein (TIGR02543 family)